MLIRINKIIIIIIISVIIIISIITRIIIWVIIIILLIRRRRRILIIIEIEIISIKIIVTWQKSCFGLMVVGSFNKSNKITIKNKINNNRNNRC